MQWWMNMVIVYDLRHQHGISLIMHELCNEFVSSLRKEVGNYCVFADNYYGGFALGEDIHKQDFYFVFTMRKNQPTFFWDFMHQNMTQKVDNHAIAIADRDDSFVAVSWQDKAAKPTNFH